MTTIGFIGLGNMGQAMVARLLETGHSVGVWNRTASAGDELVSSGATRLASPVEALQCDITLSMLANDQAVDAVFTQDTLTRAQTSLHINMASISLETAREIEARHTTANVRYLGAPVLGRPPVARTGQLNILAGGSQAALEAAQPVLDHLGKKTWHIGARAADASLVKIAVNYNIIHALQALGESINLVERGGVNPQLFVDVLTESLFNGVVYSVYGKLIANRDYFPAAFNAQLGLKDLILAQQAGAEVGSALPAAPMLRELFESAVADATQRDGDWSIIAEVIREQDAHR